VNAAKCFVASEKQIKDMTICYLPFSWQVLATHNRSGFITQRLDKWICFHIQMYRAERDCNMECPFKRASRCHWNCKRSSTLGFIPHFNMQTKTDQIFKTCKDVKKWTMYRIFFPPTTCPARTLWFSSPGCGCSVTDFWVWDAQGALLRRPDDDGKVMGEPVVPRGGLKPNFY
jgi:hypothetical protein